MAEITIQSDQTKITEISEISLFLDKYDIGFEQWNVQRLEEQERTEGLTEEEHILDAFAPEIERLKIARGYQHADVIALKPSTPNLDGILGKFDREHLHSEDEVRFVIKGQGVFSIHGEDGVIFDIKVQAGDLLMVPARTWHWFTLCEDRTIQCIRLFLDKSGWIPDYRADA